MSNKLDYSNLLASHLDRKASANPELASIYKNSASQTDIVKQIKVMEATERVDIFTKPACFLKETYQDTDSMSALLILALRHIRNRGDRLIFLLADTKTKVQTYNVPLEISKATLSDLANYVSNLFVKDKSVIGFDLHFKNDQNGRAQAYELTLLFAEDGRSRSEIVDKGLLELSLLEAGEGLGEDYETSPAIVRQTMLQKAKDSLEFHPTFMCPQKYN